MRKLFFTSTLCALFSVISFAQKISLEQFKSWKPRNIGPAGMSGRITTIDVVLDNPNIIYLGSASGGVWKTENSGNSWTPVFDEQPTQNIGSVSIQQSNPNIVWVGTGEGIQETPLTSAKVFSKLWMQVKPGSGWVWKKQEISTG
jgi:ligand-binding sensor domain-containing protein